MDPRPRSLLLGAAAAALFPPKSSAMSHKAIPASGGQLPVLALARWETFEDGLERGERAGLRGVVNLLDSNDVDSSRMYGSSECVGGELIAYLGTRKKFSVATKVWTRGRDDGIAQMER